MNSADDGNGTERMVQLGRLGRVVGLEGGLLFHALGPAEAELAGSLTTLEVEGQGALRIRSARKHGRGTGMFFEGIRRPETARPLTGAAVSVPLQELPDDFVPADFLDVLLGLPVVLAGRELGRVLSVCGAAGHEYLELEPGGQLVPLNAPYVHVTESLIELVDPPAGLV